MEATNETSKVVRRLRVAGQSVVSGRAGSPAGITAGNARAFQRRVTAPEVLQSGSEDLSPPASPWDTLKIDLDSVSAKGYSSEAKSHLSLCNHRLLNAPDLKGRLPGCFSLRFSPDDSLLAAGFFNGNVIIYDVANGSQISKWNVAQASGSTDWKPEDVGVTNLRWYPGEHGEIIATVDTTGSTHIWGDPGKFPRSENFNHLVEIPGKSCLNALAFSMDGSRLAVAGYDRVIQIYDVAPERARFSSAFSSTLGNGISAPGKVTRHSLKVRVLSAHPSNRDVFLSGGVDQHILIWDMRTGADAVAVIAGTQISGDAMEISNDGNMLLAGSHRPKIPLQLFDLRTYEVVGNYTWRGCLDCNTTAPVSSFHMQKRPSLDTAWTSSSCSLFAASWDADTNRIIAAAGEHESQARVFQRSAHPSRPLKVVGTLEGEHGGFWSAAVSADGRSAAFGDSSGAVHLVDIAGAMI